MSDIKRFVDNLGGVATVRDLADELQVSEQVVRTWAHENDVPRAGNSFAFTAKAAAALADDLDADDDQLDPDSDDDTEDLDPDSESDDADDDE